MADKRKGYKHGDFLKGDPNPHVDTYKYKDRQTGKITSHKVKGSEMKVSKKPRKPRAGIQSGLNPKKDKFKPVIIIESKAKGGRAGYNSGGRTNLLEELGRVEGERSNRNRRAEVSRIHGELNKDYKSGGAVLKGKKVGIQIK